MMKMTEEIRKELFSMQDLKYRDFQKGLIPTRDADSLIGVRTPALRSYAKQLARREDISDFLDDLPHSYFDEDQLHAFIISEIKDYDTCMAEVEKFLPYVDNWATCDQMSPKVFKKHKEELLAKIREWIGADGGSDETADGGSDRTADGDSGRSADGTVDGILDGPSERPYMVRFGIGMLMQHFLDEDYDPEYPELVAAVRSEEYYVNMMIAWYFATALAKQYESVLPYLENRRLDVWTHNKTIQKAVESFRITPEQKEYLKTLRIRKK